MYINYIILNNNYYVICMLKGYEGICFKIGNQTYPQNIY